MREATKAYLAGLIDGEGCLTIAKQIRKNRKSPCYRCSITMSNTDARLVSIFKLYFGGNYYKRPDKRKEKNWADSWTWHCPDGNAIDFLKSIRKHLIAKHSQATILIEFQAYKSNYERYVLRGKGSKPLSNEEVERRENYYLEIKALNTKGRFHRQNKLK
jgi:LAGLIDADG DNA endonuclease family protein